MKESADEELQRVKHQLAALEQWLERTSLEQATKLEQLLQEHTRTEAALAHERNLLRTLIDNIPDYIYVKDAEGRFLIANAALARRMGAARAEELLGRTDFDYYPKDVAARYEAYGWHVENIGEDLSLDRLEQATRAAMEVEDRPSLIIMRSHIGYGAPNKQDTSSAHGSPSGPTGSRGSSRVS